MLSFQQMQQLSVLFLISAQALQEFATQRWRQENFPGSWEMRESFILKAREAGQKTAARKGGRGDGRRRVTLRIRGFS